MPRLPNHILVGIKAFLALLALVAGVWFGLQIDSSPSAEPPVANGAVFESEKPLSPFRLRDHQGHPFDIGRLREHWTFIYFGYTYCPDLCPTTLAALSELEKQLAKHEANDQLQYVFISLDPRRDTSERLAQYVAFFSPRLLGTSGDDADLAVLAEQFGIAYDVPDVDTNDYLVDHTDVVLLVSPDAGFVAVLTPPHSGERIASDFRRIYDWHHTK